MKQGVIVRIVAFIFFPLMVVAMFMSLAGVRGPIQVDDTFMNFLRRASFVSNGWNIGIPNIPKIQELVTYGFAWRVFTNFWINVVNGFITICNWAINFMNWIINIFTFVAAMIKLLVDYASFSYNNTGPLQWWH